MSPVTWPDLFQADVADEFVARIRRLTPDARPQWGTMDAAQMLAHCSVAYRAALDPAFPRPAWPVRIILRLFVRPTVVGPKPYRPSLPTGPDFKISGQRDLERERDILIGHLRTVQRMGRSAFSGRPSPAFGRMTADEWNILFAKHLDHHLGQFGV